MKKNISIALAAILVMAGLATAAPGWAAEEDSSVALTILKKTKALLEPERPSIRKVVMSLSAKGETVQKVMGQAFKTFPDGKRMVLVMLVPDDVKGMGYLIMERENQPDVMYVYIPSMRRTREISGLVDRYASFFGTDFTYSDLGFINLNGEYRVLGEEACEGVDAYKVEEKVPVQPAAYYSKIITWVAKDSMLPLRRDYYAPSGDLWKTELFKDVSVVDGVPTTMRIVMKDVQANTSTELKLSELQYCGTLSDELFDPKNLAKVAENPIWQPYCTLPTK